MKTIEPLPEGVKQRWSTAGRFADILEAEIKSRSKPLIARVTTWFTLCRITQDVEEQLLLAEDRSASEIQLHRALLSLAIAGGEGLLLEADHSDLSPLGIGQESLEAKLDSLRITFEQWHTEPNPRRQSAILREVFGATA